MRFLGSLSVAFLSTFAAAANPRQLEQRELERRDCSVGRGGLKNKLTIINATPYPFYRSRVESCQVDKWSIPNTPAVVDPGKSATFEYTITRGGDASADISFILKIDGALSQKHFNIHVQGRNRLVGYTISAEVLGGLNTAGHGSGQGVFNFGDIKDALPQPGYPDVFVLSGNETYGYGTVEPPTDWMNSMGPNLKKLSINELVIPASHDSGMSQTVDGIGIDFNTRTQDANIYNQLVRGIRMLDLRPHLGPNDDDFRLAHFTNFFGAFGESLADAMNGINRFQKENPGELIILDLIPGFTRLKGPSSTPFSEQQFNDLLDTLIKGLPGLSTEYDLTVDAGGSAGLTSEPIETFYKKTSSPIFLRVPSDKGKWKGRVPSRNGSKTTGAVSSDLLPYASKWSDTNDANRLRTDQLDYFTNDYSSDQPFMGVFLETLQGAQNADPLGKSIRSLAFDAKDVLYENAWNWSNAKKYINFLQFDYVLNKQVASLAAAMNYQYAFARHDAKK